MKIYINKYPLKHPNKTINENINPLSTKQRNSPTKFSKHKKKLKNEQYGARSSSATTHGKTQRKFTR